MKNKTKAKLFPSGFGIRFIFGTLLGVPVGGAWWYFLEIESKLYGIVCVIITMVIIGVLTGKYGSKVMDNLYLILPY